MEDIYVKKYLLLMEQKKYINTELENIKKAMKRGKS